MKKFKLLSILILIYFINSQFISILLITNSILDYEKNSLLNIRIRVNDKFNASFEKTFSIRGRFAIHAS